MSIKSCYESYYRIAEEVYASTARTLSEADSYLIIAGILAAHDNKSLCSNDEISTCVGEGNETVAHAVSLALSTIEFENIRKLADSTNAADLEAALSIDSWMGRNRDGFFSTPKGVAQLALAILNLKPNEKILDCGSGTGTFLLEASQEVPSIEAMGIELDPKVYAISVIRARHVHAEIDYRNGDAFVIAGDNSKIKTFDKAFSNYPLGLRTVNLAGTSDYIDNIIKGFDRGKRPTYADWAFNKLLVDSINDEGKAVAIMSAGSAFVGQDTPMRKRFIENGWISAVVALPAGVFAPYSGISTCLVVLSHGAKDVRFVDATDLGTIARRTTELDKESIDEIVGRLSEDSDKSRLVSVDEIAAHGYDLCAERYLFTEIEIPNGVAFGSVIKRITRGAFISARKLDELSSSGETSIGYLNVKNINDGKINDDLPSLSEVDPNLEKYLVSNGSLVLSKAINTIKFAVAEIPEGRKLLASSNLYIIELNREKINPYFLAAFLASPTGKELLSRAAVGTTLLSLSLTNLKEMKVPLPSLEEQKPVASAYRAKLDEIEVLKLQLERSRQEVADIFDKEG